MRDQRFNPDDEPDQYGRKWVHDLLAPLSGTNPLITNVSFRRDRTAGGAVTFRGVDIGQGYLLPRFTFTRDADLGFEALFTPTATRFLNWYVSAGIGNDLDEWKFVAEGGLKVNVRVHRLPEDRHAQLGVRGFPLRHPHGRLRQAVADPVHRRNRYRRLVERTSGQR
jgi:hypothetical protein